MGLLCHCSTDKSGTDVLNRFVGFMSNCKIPYGGLFNVVMILIRKRMDLEVLNSEAEDSVPRILFGYYLVLFLTDFLIYFLVKWN